AARRRLGGGRACAGRRVRGDAEDGQPAGTDGAHRAVRGRRATGRHEAGRDAGRRRRAPLHDRATRTHGRDRTAATSLSRRARAARRRHVLRAQRRDRCPNLHVRLAGPPALACSRGSRAAEDVMAQARRLAIDIIVPLYNEESIVAEFHRQLTDAIAPLRREHDVRIYYVNDGSLDHTGAELLKLANDDAGVTILELSRNFGHQAALTAGLDCARGDVVITIDGDGQHPPELIGEVVTLHLAGYDVVLTQRVAADLSRFKRWTSAAFYRLLGSIGNTRITAASADYRLLTRPVLEALRRMREYHRFLRGMVAWAGYRTVVLPYTERARLGGTTKYSLGGMARLA